MAVVEQVDLSVRELEQRMTMQKEWEHKPRPKTNAPMPLDPASPREYMEKVRLMYDMARLAFETDSTRLITLFLDSANSPAIDIDGMKISDGYHNLSHHGKNEAKDDEMCILVGDSVGVTVPTSCTLSTKQL